MEVPVEGRDVGARGPQKWGQFIFHVSCHPQVQSFSTTRSRPQNKFYLSENITFSTVHSRKETNMSEVYWESETNIIIQHKVERW